MFMLCSGNPFVSAYLQTDWFGKWIFVLLFCLSAVSWSLLIYKGWMLSHVKRVSKSFASLFSEKDPLGLQAPRAIKETLLEIPHPFFEMYKAFKVKALSVIQRNHYFSSGKSSFSPLDLEFLEAELKVSMVMQMKKLEKNVFILSTIVTLGPFVGLLGTVWGILVSFSQVEARALSGGSEKLLAGLSLALTTTVIGLLVAIPALIGYNYLKNALKDFKRDMEEFSHLLLTSTELHYQRAEHVSKTVSLP